MKRLGIIILFFIMVFTSCGKEKTENKPTPSPSMPSPSVTQTAEEKVTLTPEPTEEAPQIPVIVTAVPVPASKIVEYKPGEERPNEENPGENGNSENPDEKKNTPTPTPAPEIDDPKAIDKIEIKEGISETIASDYVSPVDESENAGKAREMISKMSLEEKVAQMFIVTPEGLTGVNPVTEAGNTTKNRYNKYPVGGIIYFAQNLVNTDQTKRLLSKTQEYAKARTGLPVFTCVDEEGGSVTRIAGRDGFGIENSGHMAEIGMSGDANKAYEVGNNIGNYLSVLGFNVDFAPDADVLVNPDNNLIRLRSFGTDADTVTKMCLKYYEGLKANKVLGCFKHYPGHGATSADSHKGVSVSERSLEDIKGKELLPFKECAGEDVGMIMVGHISFPNILHDYTPSSMSSYFVTDILRKEYGYEGIIVTDSLSMGAITKYYDDAKAAVSAIKAGNDMLLCPNNFEAAYNAVLDAVRNGEISEERINKSVERIIKRKLEMSQ